MALKVTLVPLDMNSPTFGPYRVQSFSYTGNSTDGAGPHPLGGGYQFKATAEDGRGTILVCTGAENGRYALQCSVVESPVAREGGQ